MKRCLADVNVLLPLLVRHHEHYGLAFRWLDGLAPGEATSAWSSRPNRLLSMLCFRNC
jgi:predicted nucleic acid-binding protein